MDEPWLPYEEWKKMQEWKLKMEEEVMKKIAQDVPRLYNLHRAAKDAVEATNKMFQEIPNKIKLN